MPCCSADVGSSLESQQAADLCAEQVQICVAHDHNESRLRACREVPGSESAPAQQPLDPEGARVVIFYHVYATGDWNAVVRDQASASASPVSGGHLPVA